MNDKPGVREKKSLTYNGVTYKNRYALSIAMNSHRPDPIYANPPKTRVCLRCRESFMSQGDYRCPACHEEERVKHFSKRESQARMRRPPSRSQGDVR